MKRSRVLLAICFFTGMILCPDRCFPSTRILKTAYKTFTIGTWRGTDILCEPYKVKKNDWIYKIFRKKGKLSETDFPLFINIFKHLNPHIPDPDTIRPGQKITIPLKKLDPLDSAYQEKSKVIVPILEMNELTKKSDIAPLSQQQPEKADVLLHQPETYSIQHRDMEKVRRYASIVQGQILDNGTYYLPGPHQKDTPLDLSSTPLVLLKNNSKIIILPHNFPQADFLRSLNGIWKNVSFMEMGMLEKRLLDVPAVSVIPKKRTAALAMLAQKTKFDLRPFETTLLMDGGIEIPIKASQISRNNQSDLLIFFSSIYGNALSILQHQGFTTLSISPDDDVMDMAQKLFKALGILTLHNPAFKNRSTRQSISIPGLFVGDGKNIFISPQPVSYAVQHFFARNHVVILQVNN